RKWGRRRTRPCAGAALKPRLWRGKTPSLEGLSMFITKKHLSRRTLLRGAGAAVALPLLDSMIPAHTALAQTAAQPQPRLGCLYIPHGATMDLWTPATE